MDLIMSEAVTLAGVLLPIVAILVQLIKQADINPRWLPFVAIGLGTATGVLFGVSARADLFLYGLAGFLAGAGSSGLYDAIESAKGDK